MLDYVKPLMNAACTHNFWRTGHNGDNCASTKTCRGLEALHGFVQCEPTAFACSKSDTSRALLHSGITPYSPGIQSWQLGRRLALHPPAKASLELPSESFRDRLPIRAAERNLSSGVGESCSAKMENNRRWYCHMLWFGVFFPLKSYVI